MKKLIINCNKFLILSLFFILFIFQKQALADTMYTLDRVNFRTGPSLSADVISVISPGTFVEELERLDEWSTVDYNGTTGYIFNEYLGTRERYDEIKSSQAELLNWSEAKDVFIIGTDALITDVRTGLQYYVRSFSNGLHADVEPVTVEDTQIMLATYGGRWDWDTRPIWVTINGRTLAASINGMPHGGGINSNNGMDGQVCIHFVGSRTHNGNKSHENDHQNSIMEAWNAVR